MVNNVNIHINNEYYGKQKRTKIIFLQSYGKLFIQLKFTVLPHAEMYESTLQSKRFQTEVSTTKVGSEQRT